MSGLYIFLGLVIMKKLAPCKDCTERYFACHDSCEKYICWRMADAKYKEARSEELRKRNERVTWSNTYRKNHTRRK